MAGTLIGVPVATIVAAPQTAHATVAAGDIVFEQLQNDGNYPAQVVQRASSGTLTNLSNTAYPYEDHTPDVSPNGSQITYTGIRPLVDQPSQTASVLMVMNSDGSGQTQLHSASSTNLFADSAPRWSPSGQQIAYIHQVGNASDVWKVNADGSGDTQLTSTGTAYNVSWSPSGTKLTYDSVNTATGNSQLYIMNADGSGQHLLAGSDSGYYDTTPTWAPNDSRIYFLSSQGSGIWYYSSTNDFSTETGPTQLSTSAVGGGETGSTQIRVSADSSTLVYGAPGASGCSIQIWTIASTGGTPSQLTTDCSYQAYSPTFVSAAWPPAPPSNTTATFSAPSFSDAPYTRQVTVNLSATGDQRFDVGWSTSNTTAPNTSYLQSITNMTTKKGSINFLGKYASGTTWNGGTLPDQNWYLWVRPVSTGGTAGSWSTPLLVHTPKKPVWVVVGDSFSSGHHQDADEPLCTDPNDTYVWPVTPACTLTGAPHIYPNDTSASWAYPAVVSYDSGLHLPSGWSWSYFSTDVQNVALSGAPTSAFGASGQTPGTSAWAAAGTQMGSLRAALYLRPDSWNIVSMTGGADDTSWVTTLKDWYSSTSHWNATDLPWKMDTATSNCPDSNAVYSGLKAGSPTLDSTIQTNLQGVADYAVSLSPGVRVLNVGYPYVMDATDSSNAKSYCNSDHGTWKGAKSVIDDLNADHTAVTGSNVKYVDLTASDAFGLTPINSGYIETYRYYGYPHPTITAAGGTGEAKEASKAVAVLTGTW